MSTIDIPFKKAIKKGDDLNDPNSPHLLKFEDTIPHVGEFQSMEVGIYRDGQRKHSIGLYSFHLEPRGKGTPVTFQLNDMRRKVIKLDYAGGDPALQIVAWGAWECAAMARIKMRPR